MYAFGAKISGAKSILKNSWVSDKQLITKQTTHIEVHTKNNLFNFDGIRKKMPIKMWRYLAPQHWTKHCPLHKVNHSSLMFVPVCYNYVRIIICKWWIPLPVLVPLTVLFLIWQNQPLLDWTIHPRYLHKTQKLTIRAICLHYDLH